MSGKIKKNKGSFRIKVIIAVCLVILVLIPSLILFFHNKEMAGFVSYKGDSYTFSYPNDWIISKNERKDINGTEFFLQPPDAAPPETPHITIDIAPSTQTTMNRLTDPFVIFKYKKMAAVVNGIQAQKYTNVVNSSEGVLHSTAFVFQANGNIYLISLGYKQDTVDSQLEDKFQQVVTKFTL